MGMRDPGSIFTDRVQNYLAYRPGYPPNMLDLLCTECALSQDSLIADVGSGTGLLSEIFLENGNPVFGVEPNIEMRAAGENRLRSYSRFVSVVGRAEATTLQNHSVDYITAGQAFHWFEPERSKTEFIRILKPGGWVVAVYNIARSDTPFEIAYQQFCEAYLGQKGVEQKEVDIYTPFFGEGFFTEKQIDGLWQRFDYKGLCGRILSRANTPEETTPRYSEMMETLGSLFEHYQHDGQVEISYATQVVYGRLTKPEN